MRALIPAIAAAFAAAAPASAQFHDFEVSAEADFTSLTAAQLATVGLGPLAASQPTPVRFIIRVNLNEPDLNASPDVGSYGARALRARIGNLRDQVTNGGAPIGPGLALVSIRNMAAEDWVDFQFTPVNLTQASAFSRFDYITIAVQFDPSAFSGDALVTPLPASAVTYGQINMTRSGQTASQSFPLTNIMVN